MYTYHHDEGTAPSPFHRTRPLMPRYNLYTLAAPDHAFDFRYAGATVNRLVDRFYTHISDARTGAAFGRPVADWIRDLLDEGHMPVIAPLEGFDTEATAIAGLRDQGYDLLNVGDGGEGREPIPFTDAELALLGTASDREVARQLGCHYRTVFRRRNALGIPPWSGADNERRFLDCEVHTLRRLYHAGGRSMAGMARSMGVCESTVRKILKGERYADAGGPIA